MHSIMIEREQWEWCEQNYYRYYSKWQPWMSLYRLPWCKNFSDVLEDTECVIEVCHSNMLHYEILQCVHRHLPNEWFKVTPKEEIEQIEIRWMWGPNNGSGMPNLSPWLYSTEVVMHLMWKMCWGTIMNEAHASLHCHCGRHIL